MSRFIYGYLKTKYAPVFAVALFFICSCTVNSNRYAQDSLIISFQFEPDGLSSHADAAFLTVINESGASVFDSAFVINPDFGDFPQFDVRVRDETDLSVSAWLFDDSRRPLYRAFQTVTMAGDAPPILILEMKQSGYLSGARVRILRDEPPWDSFALDSSLAEIGLTEGSAGNQFHVCPSFDLPSISLDPGSDLLIISNDQPQDFYDNLAMNMAKVLNFIRSGGTALWETCDLAWNYGSYTDAGLDTLPGQITFGTAYDPINIIDDRNLEMVSGLEDTLAGIYASNKYLSNVPDSAVIYMKNSAGLPTLIGIRCGEGLILYSGQPLEYNFDRRSQYNIGYLLPRILHFLLGRPWQLSSLDISRGYSDSRAKIVAQN